MKRIILLIAFLFLYIILAAKEYSISYVNSNRKEYLPIHKINQEEYVDINDIVRIFDGKIFVEQKWQAVEIKILNKKFSFLYDLNWVKFGKNSYNLYSNFIIENGNYYIPSYFLTLCSEKFFRNSLVIENDNIIVKLPLMDKYLINNIVIDPGHGGKDPGAVGRNMGLKEKDIVLNIAKKTKKLIEDNLDVDVLLTRDCDKFVSLHDRTEYANNHNADLFVSIHCNASLSRKTNGSEVYFLSTAQSDEARAVEALENKVIKFEDPESIALYSDLDFILYDMRQTEYLNESSELSDICQRELINNLKTKDRGVKQANFYVLRGAFMPAILVEIAFISNKWEEKKLGSESFQEQAAKAIFFSVKEFKDKYDKIN